MVEVLSEQQKRFFDVFGYLVLPGLLADVIEDVTSEFEEVFARQGDAGNGGPHAGPAPTVAANFIDNSELCGLLDDPRIDGIATGLLGGDYNYLSSVGQLMVGDTKWHPDGWGHEPFRFLRMSVYLDPVGADSGALRVIPGSHKAGAFGDEAVQALTGQQRKGFPFDPDDLDGIAEMLAAHTQKREEERDVPRPQWCSRELGLAGADIPAAVVASEPGDVVVYDQNILHSAWGGSNRRRMLALSFSEHCPDAHLPELRRFIAQFARYWKEQMYEENLIATAGEQRMRHLAQVIANEDMLPGLVQRLQERVPASVQTPWRRKAVHS